MIEDLQRRLGYTFHNPALLRTALTHSSYANEHRREKVESNERLEFLGDAILGLITAEFLYKEHPNMPEGQLSKLRADLVCEKSLAEVASQISLGEELYLSRGEQKTGAPPSVCADAIEAILAAAYLDGGIEIPKEMIHRFILKREPSSSGQTDYKTRFQELVQQKKNQEISYQLLRESGPDHDKHFEVALYLNGKRVGIGEGSSKKRAEQEAAHMALKKLYPKQL